MNDRPKSPTRSGGPRTGPHRDTGESSNWVPDLHFLPQDGQPSALLAVASGQHQPHPQDQQKGKSMTRTLGRAARFGSVLLATGAIAAIAPTAAHADSAPLTIDVIDCESGALQFFCEATVSGGVGPITVAWSPAPSGSCTANSRVLVTVVATDSTGVSVSRSRNVVCRRGMLP